jgi:hypothetical protein
VEASVRHVVAVVPVRLEQVLRLDAELADGRVGRL